MLEICGFTIWHRERQCLGAVICAQAFTRIELGMHLIYINVTTLITFHIKRIIPNHLINIFRFFGNIRKNRLQMQTKYTSLTPIVRKINEASIERKKYEKEIGRLCEELSEAKKKLRETHLSISSYVNELSFKKGEIDKNR